MTHVHYIDCSKWKKVIGIALWIGATIGLASGIYGLITYTFVSNNESCYYLQLPKNDGSSTASCAGDGSFSFYFVWFIAILGNGGNAFAIWDVTNGHYKWLEIRCGKKPKNENRSL